MTFRIAKEVRTFLIMRDEGAGMGDVMKVRGAALTYVADWSGWLDGDTIYSSTWIVPFGLISLSTSHDTQTASVKISGGEVGETYSIKNRITSVTGGQTDERVLKITVVASKGPDATA